MAVNETSFLPSSVSEIPNWFTSFAFPWAIDKITHVAPRIQEIILAPIIQTEMLWAVIPLLATLLLMTFYFGAHKGESLGWNTAFGNSMVLIFTSINLLQHLYGNISLDSLAFNEKTLIALALMGEGFFLMFIDFFHFVPEKVAFYISSPLHVNLLAILGVIIVYSETIGLDFLTIFAVILIYVVVGVGLHLFKFFIPSTKAHIEKVTQHSYLELEKPGIDDK
ncbi:MAG TPA: hypothetical protein VJB90_03145 [Candidatus Nanoarchaeia archaeon]|nr:hypothetical protein [Candidatus Nanoarchaeia archaeon]